MHVFIEEAKMKARKRELHSVQRSIRLAGVVLWAWRSIAHFHSQDERRTRLQQSQSVSRRAMRVYRTWSCHHWAMAVDASRRIQWARESFMEWYILHRLFQITRALHQAT